MRPFVKEAISLLTHLTDMLTQLITNLYISTGLVGIILAMALESCCIPLPSEIVMPLAGIMIASHKILQGTSTTTALILVALAGAIGCLLGSIAAYGIGYAGGRPLMLKYGRYVLISQHDADKADQFFQRWGSTTAFFSRLLPVVRTYISLPAGIAKMPFVKFCIYSFLGSFPWSLGLAYLGLILGNNLSRLSPIFHSLDIVILVVVVLLIVLYVWRHLNNDKKARVAAAARSQQAATTPAQAWGQPAQPTATQPQWGQFPNQPQQFSQAPQQWGQPVPQQWGQQPPMQPQQPPQRGQQPQQWGQPPMQPQQWGQQPPNQGQQTWGQPPQSPQSGYPQQPQQTWGQPPYPQQPGYPQQPQQGDDRSMRR